ncbi:ribosome maturation factor RimP [Legionella israelensis]|uniref:Ribosome maturation factor RimP n=1 Tax=Legionella israelensis TaxID=454 RepID=A0A0W0W8P2_9GAMM|nr:ribosome maturation factor RimP [Legionella israelensis]KTD28737.1 Ribosome maturation factor RimP [Legionella israelensis]QBS09400.1 ribosome maturation factor RimP [Legionella israelensis]SCX88383.1 ribosome maturation factor RimP [Legionella israelensis DSM 19235]STX60301.1 NusA-like protein [Legionella israelensis]
MIKDKLKQLLEPVIEDAGYQLWGIEYLAQGKHSLLRIYIDKPEGIGIDDCERVSKQVSSLLDVEDPISGNYNLEVSSPGISRPLFFTWQYKKYIGSDVQLKLIKPLKNKRKITGTIASVSDDAVVLEIDQEQHEILFSAIAKANLTV